MRTIEANASFTSKRSMSLILSPLSERILFVAGTGPVSMIVGSVPTLHVARILALGFNPRAVPKS